MRMKTTLMLIGTIALMISAGCTGPSYTLNKKGSKEHHQYCPGDVLVYIDKYGTQHICEAV